MRRGQVTLTGMLQQDLIADPLTAMKTAGFGVPDYAINCIVSVRHEKGTSKMMFFENSDEMLTQYTKFLLFRRRPDAVISYYIRANANSPWLKVPAPTLVSTHVETKLR
jgi:hypothetical protein